MIIKIFFIENKDWVLIEWRREGKEKIWSSELPFSQTEFIERRTFKGDDYSLLTSSFSPVSLSFSHSLRFNCSPFLPSAQPSYPFPIPLGSTAFFFFHLLTLLQCDLRNYARKKRRRNEENEKKIRAQKKKNDLSIYLRSLL